MKKLLLLGVLTSFLTLKVSAADPDLPITVNTNQNVQIIFSPNGQLDTVISWQLDGAGSIINTTPPNARAFIFVTNGVGTSTLTFTATSQGNVLVSRVIVTVVAPPPPATTLGAAASPVGK